MNLQSLKGRSFPSPKFGAWIVDSVSHTIDGRSRLLSADMRREAWVYTSSLVHAFELLDNEAKTIESSPVDQTNQPHEDRP